MSRFMREIQRRFLIVEARTLIERNENQRSGLSLFSLLGSAIVNKTEVLAGNSNATICDATKTPSLSAECSRTHAIRCSAHHEPPLRASFVGEKLLMRRPCGAPIQTEIVAT